MSYAYYFELVKKSDIENLPERISSAKEQNEHIDFFEVLQQETIFKFGLLDWDDTADRIISTGVPLFSNELQSMFSDYTVYTVGKAGVLEAIDIYSRKIEKNFLGYLEDDIIDDEDWFSRHPYLGRILSWINSVCHTSFIPKQVVSHKDKCVQAVINKLKWISPYYRSHSFMADVDVEEDFSEKLDVIKSQPVNIVDLNMDYSARFRMADNWLYEYEVFTLCCILKHVDWDNYTILFVGR